ncbi:MAG: cytochrome c [Xanthomonadales bacterium]|nr:cytochrome c [Xanthomonadales bacterium]
MDRSRNLLAAFVVAILMSCAAANPLQDFEELTPATVLDHPEPAPSDRYSEAVVAHGKYLVTLLRCGACHTDGALTGTPNPERLLAGSSVGIAYTSPLENSRPGVVYPSNLTPDAETGLGRWTEQQVVDMIRTGSDRHGGRAVSVMPYPAYAELNDADARAIAAYLSSLPAVRHEVPYSVSEGSRAPAPFVHFGVYRSRR